MAEAMKGNENRKDPEQIRELIPPSEKKQSQPEANKTRAKIAETFNTGAERLSFALDRAGQGACEKERDL